MGEESYFFNEIPHSQCEINEKIASKIWIRAKFQCEIIQGLLAGKLLAPFLPRLDLHMDFPVQQAHPAPCVFFI